MMDIKGFFRGSPRVPAKMVVVGDAMLDMYHYVDAKRVSPEFPIPVLKSETVLPGCIYPGGAANVALQMRHFNANVRLVSFLDASAEERCQAEGVETSYCMQLGWGEVVPRKHRFYQGNFPLCRWDVEMGDYGIKDIGEARAKLQELYESAVEGQDVVIFSDYDKGVFGDEPWPGLDSEDVITIVDPKKGTPLSRWKGCRIFKPNYEEALSLSGCTSWKSQCDYFQKALGCQAVVITRGAHGVVGKFDGDYFEYLPQRGVAAESVIGAGDCFVAFLGMAMAKNTHLNEAVGLACEAGAVYVQKKHNEPITCDELQRHFDPLAAKYVTEQFLREVAMREKLVWTNGVFDLCHAGHVECIRRAKAMGDKLVVALNSDRSARGLKGEGHPVVPLEDRMRVIASLEAVDYVVSFDETSVLDSIKRVMPALVVKGGEYTPEQVVGHGVVPVAVVPQLPGRSTTSLVEKLRRMS